MDRRKKYKNFLFINTGTKDDRKWARETKATDFAIAFNPQTETYDYIADELKTSETTGFEPSLEQTLYAYIGEPVYDFLMPKARKFSRGGDATGEVLIVYQETNDKGENLADLFDVSFEWGTNDMVAGTLAYTIHLNETPTFGTATISEDLDEDGNKIWIPVFTPDGEAVPEVKEP